MGCSLWYARRYSTFCAGLHINNSDVVFSLPFSSLYCILCLYIYIVSVLSCAGYYLDLLNSNNNNNSEALKHPSACQPWALHFIKQLKYKRSLIYTN